LYIFILFVFYFKYLYFIFKKDKGIWYPSKLPEIFMDRNRSETSPFVRTGVNIVPANAMYSQNTIKHYKTYEIV